MCLIHLKLLETKSNNMINQMANRKTIVSIDRNNQ